MAQSNYGDELVQTMDQQDSLYLNRGQHGSTGGEQSSGECSGAESEFQADFEDDSNAMVDGIKSIAPLYIFFAASSPRPATFSG